MGTTLQNGIDSAKAGRMEEALDFLRKAAGENPNNAEVWVWLSAIIDDEEKQTEFLQKALVIDPDNKPAQRGMAFLRRKKFIAPKPGETLSDHTRPIGVFKTSPQTPAADQPLEPVIETSSVEEGQQEVPGAAFDMDTDNTIPSEVPVLDPEFEFAEPQDALSELIENTAEPTVEDDEIPSLVLEAEEEPPIIEDTESEAGEAALLEDLDKTGHAEEEPDEQDEAELVTSSTDSTQVSPVIAASAKDVEISDEEAPEEGPEDLGEPDEEEDGENEAVSIEAETPETEDEQPAPFEPSEGSIQHPLVQEAKKLKWQILLYGLILTAFIVVGILVGSTLLRLMNPKTASVSMNIAPIANQSGVFLVEGQDFNRLNLQQSFPASDSGLLITRAEFPQLILKDPLVTDPEKLALLDSSKTAVSHKLALIDEKHPKLEPESALEPGRYCLSYSLNDQNEEALFWCFIKD